MELRSGFAKIFILVGVILLLLFVAADIVEVERLNAWYLLFGVVFTAFGIYLSVSGRKPPEESARFRTLRRLAKRGRKDDRDEAGDDERQGDEQRR
jgi:hypothetical protein